MQDIGAVLEQTKDKNKCSALNALLILLEAKEDNNVYLLQSQPQQETRGGLCNKGNNKINEL